MSTEDSIIGVDFGSTACRAAYLLGEDLVTIPSPPGDITNVSTLVMRPKRGEPQDGVTVTSLKYFLGNDDKIVMGGTVSSGDELVSFVLRRLRETATTFQGEEVERAILVVPERYTPQRRALLMRAAKTAGFRALAFIDDVAAAVRGHTSGSDSPRTILVISWGFIGFECSVIRSVRQQVRVIAHEDAADLSGAEIDRQIAMYCLRKLDEIGERVKLQSWDLQHWLLLVGLAQRCKEEVTIRSAGNVVMPTELTGKPDILVSIDGPLINTFVAPLVDQAHELIMRTLQTSGLGPEHIDEVLLVGGSTKLAMFRERLQAFSKAPIIMPRDGLLARGAALHARDPSLFSAIEQLDVAPPPVGDPFGKAVASNLQELVSHVHQLIEHGQVHQAEMLRAEILRRLEAAFRT